MKKVLSKSKSSKLRGMAVTRQKTPSNLTDHFGESFLRRKMCGSCVILKVICVKCWRIMRSEKRVFFNAFCDSPKNRGESRQRLSRSPCGDY